MKLESKHLAPYLPYALQISTDDEGEDWVETVIGLNNEAIETSVGNYWNYTVKPILRPLSDLTKEIEHNGEKIIPVEYVFGKNHNIREVKDIYIINKNGYSFRATGLVYDQVQKLFEMHFDVVGLIDAGLAIDINTLKI